MKKMKRQLPQPMTEQDQAFMRNLLAGVRAVRDKAIGKPAPVIVRTSRAKDEEQEGQCNRESK